MNRILKYFTDSFKYTPTNNYNFKLSTIDVINNENDIIPIEDLNKPIFPSVDVNLEYIKFKFNYPNNSDIKIREFDLTARNKIYKAFIVYIDGMSDSKSINRFVLNPLMLKNRANTFNKDEDVVKSAVANNITVKRKKSFNLVDYIYSCLIPLNDTKKVNSFKEVIESVNFGECALFVDTIDTCFLSDVKGFEKRAIETPINEMVIKGSQEAFVESIRTNTSMIRRMVNNENLVIESTQVGVISKTKCAICYMKDITNNSLISEVRNRIKNLNIDYIVSSGELEGFIKENSSTTLQKCFLLKDRTMLLLHFWMVKLL